MNTVKQADLTADNMFNELFGEDADEQAAETELFARLENDHTWTLADNGALDTVIRCQHCGYTESFDSRMSALDFLVSDGECGNCGE